MRRMNGALLAHSKARHPDIGKRIGFLRKLHVDGDARCGIGGAAAAEDMFRAISNRFIQRALALAALSLTYRGCLGRNADLDRL